MGGVEFSENNLAKWMGGVEIVKKQVAKWMGGLIFLEIT